MAATIALTNAAPRRFGLRLGDGRTFVRAFAAVWALGVLLPVAGLLLLSVLRTQRAGFIFEFTFQAYADVFAEFRLDAIQRGLRICTLVTLIELLVAFPFALWLAKGCRSRWLKIVTQVLLVVPFFLSPAARTVIWRVVLGREGLVNSILLAVGVIDQPIEWLLFSEFAVHLGFVGPYFPAMVWPLYIAISLIDDDLLKASADLGGSRLDTLRFVILPLAMPGVVAGVIFTFVPMFGDNVVPALLGGGQIQTFSEAVADLIRVMNYNAAAAISLVILVLMGVLQLVFWLVLHRLGGGRDIFASLRQ